MTRLNSRLQRTSFPAARALCVLVGTTFTVACGELPTFEEPAPKSTPLHGVLRQSTQGCQLDDDCLSNLYCFQSVCVPGCSDNSSCDEGYLCSPRGRCIAVPETGSTESPERAFEQAIDTSQYSQNNESLSALLITSVEPTRISVPKGSTSVQVELAFSAPLPAEGLSYTLAYHNSETRTEVQRAHGKDRVSIDIPIQGEPLSEGEVRGVDILTAAGRVTVYLANPLSVDGFYEGVSKTQTFGGTHLPFEMVVETEPPGTLRLADASQRWVWLPAGPTHIAHIPDADAHPTNEWLRAPLIWDTSTQAWVATFATEIDNDRLFGMTVYPYGERSIRIELREDRDSEATLTGAWVDRWSGIRDRQSTDGIPQPMNVTIAGHLQLHRAGALPSLPTLDSRQQTRPWQPLPSLALSDCYDIDLQSVVGEGEEPSYCQRIGTLEELAWASPEELSACAQEYSAQRVPSSSLASQLHRFLDPQQENPSGMSFQNFLDACAAQDTDICVPKREELCARQLTAHAYHRLDGSEAEERVLATQYQQLTQNIFLGAKLAAFHSDSQHRLRWLQSSEAPIFLASALKDYNANILNQWQSRVVTTMLDSLFGQLDDVGLTFLARANTDPTAIAIRKEIILDLGVLWQSTAEALTLYTQRIHLIEDRDTQRKQLANELSQQFFRLYLAGAILAELGRDVGTVAQNHGFGAHLASLDKDIRKLRAPFSKLIFARSAEVVTSRSVDPSSGNVSLLSELQATARQAIGDAQQSVDIVHREAELNELTEAFLRDRYEDQILDLRNELIQLCGLPIDCDASDVGKKEECAIQTDSHACGFTIKAGGENLQIPADVETSEAAGRLQTLWAAVEAREIAAQQVAASLSRSTLLSQSIVDFQKSIQLRHKIRVEADRVITKIANEILGMRSKLVREQLSNLLRQQDIRAAAYQTQAAALDQWSQITYQGIERDMKLIRNANSASRNAEILHLTADRASSLAEILAESVPDDVKDNVVLTQSKLIPLSIGLAVSTSLNISALTETNRANYLEAQMAQGDLEDAYYISQIEDLASLSAMRSSKDIADLEAEIQRATIENEAEQHGLRALIAAMERSLELDEQGDRELMELRDRRDTLLIETQALQGYIYQEEQAKLTVEYQVLAYLQIVQRAQLLDARFANAQQRWSNIENIIGSPDVIFSFTNRIALAEARLERARRALEDWLITLEYYAVRPFISERIAILLARNPQQLEAIANELGRIQQSCGGNETHERVDVSLRDQLLHLNLASQAPTNDGAIIVATPAQRFRALLARASSPVKRATRLNSAETIGERLARGNVLSANFQLSVHDFANLPQSCNAKVRSMAVQLIGVDAPHTQPVVSLVYDGSSELRSCQPDIRELVLAVGPEATAFAPITSFQTGARAISPIAGVGKFGPASTWNATLEGTPLAAGYTVLIDLEHPSNQDVNWESLEDIRIQFEYSYQDPFPAGQCQ